VCHPVPVPLDTVTEAVRSRADRCPGVMRPWIADDGALVRVRLVGGRLPVAAMADLLRLSAEYGDGDLHLTKRANVQVRGVPHVHGVLPAGFVEGIRDSGLLPSPAHDLVRNVMVSPLSGRAGGRADLRPVAAELDRLLLADPRCARLAGRFLFLLDDGRGDLVDRRSDVAAVALDADHVQLRAGRDQWGPVVPLAETAKALWSMARRFLELRADGPAWHVDELAEPLFDEQVRDDRTRVTSGPPPAGRLLQVDGRSAEHVDVPDGRLTPELGDRLLAKAAEEVVVTPWRSMLLPDLDT
jgi:precorrin-3B synthase